MIRGVHHVGLTVANLPKMVSFYRQAAQFSPLPQHPFAVETRFSRIGEENRPIEKSLMLQAPNGYLELIPLDGAAEPSRLDVNQAGLRHICVQSAEGPAVYQNFSDAGAQFHSEFVSLGTGYLYAYARDPEQNVVELEGAPKGPNEAPPWLAHVAIVTHDIDRLSDFYSGLLGRRVHNRGHFHSNDRFDKVTALKNVDVKAAWIHTENLIIEMWQYINPPTEEQPVSLFSTAGINHISFEVDDIAADKLALQQSGYELCRDETICNGGKSVLGRDVDGNLIELLEIDQSYSGLSINALDDVSIIPRLAGVEAGAA